MPLSRSIFWLPFVLWSTAVVADDFDPWDQSARYELEYRV